MEEFLERTLVRLRLHPTKVCLRPSSRECKPDTDIYGSERENLRTQESAAAPNLNLWSFVKVFNRRWKKKQNMPMFVYMNSKLWNGFHLHITVKHTCCVMKGPPVSLVAQHSLGDVTQTQPCCRTGASPIKPQSHSSHTVFISFTTLGFWVFVMCF